MNAVDFRIAGFRTPGVAEKRTNGLGLGHAHDRVDLSVRRWHTRGDQRRAESLGDEVAAVVNRCARHIEHEHVHFHFNIPFRTTRGSSATDTHTWTGCGTVEAVGWRRAKYTQLPTRHTSDTPIEIHAAVVNRSRKFARCASAPLPNTIATYPR